MWMDSKNKTNCTKDSTFHRKHKETWSTFWCFVKRDLRKTGNLDKRLGKMLK